MSEKAEREGAPRRSSLRRTLSETTLPPEYLEKLEQKRKQLDESIHKYIAAKEREYKQFEKEVRAEHKLSQGQNGVKDDAKAQDEAQDGQQNALRRTQESSAVDSQAALPTRESNSSPAQQAAVDGLVQGRAAIAGLKDRRASAERDADFLGLFTPEYLTALDAKDKQQLYRPSSAPASLIQPEVESNLLAAERSNSDPIAQAKPKRPSHLELPQRTSSSGSSADSKLASAMRSPTQRPKHKRVSLAVGDAIVAPSEEVPVALSHHTIPSHSRKRSSVPQRDYPAATKRSKSADDEQKSTIETPLKEVETLAPESAMSDDTENVQALPVQATPNEFLPPSKQRKLDPDGDLFDLEDEDEDDNEDLPSPLMDVDDPDNVLESENDEDTIMARDTVRQLSISPSVTIPDRVRYDPTTGIISEPEDEAEDSPVPYLSFGSNSSVTPKDPGFRKPSVIHDPVYRGQNYAVAEHDAVENDVYGSSANRPASKGSFTAGSLGESYMAQHAEEMMKLRLARQQAQVRS